MEPIVTATLLAGLQFAVMTGLLIGFTRMEVESVYKRFTRKVNRRIGGVYISTRLVITTLRRGRLYSVDVPKLKVVLHTQPSPGDFVEGRSAHIHDVRTGDAEFDRLVSVQSGEPEKMFAILDRSTRETLVQIAKRRVKITILDHEWVLLMVLEDSSIAKIEKLAAMFASSRVVLSQVPNFLASNVESESSFVVKARSLLALLSNYPRSPCALLCAERCLLDKSPGPRFLAAVFLGMKEWKVLEAAIDSPDPASSMPMMLKEIAAQKYRDPGGHMDDALRLALEKGRPPVARAAWRACQELSVSLTPEQYLRFAETHANEALAEEVAGGMRTLSHPGVEGLLIKWLGREKAFSQAAALVLSDVGTREAVEPLMGVIQRVGLMGGDLKRDAREAIAKIQSRLGNAERGTISLAETTGPEGAVSLAPQGGEVSVTDLPRAEVASMELKAQKRDVDDGSA